MLSDLHVDRPDATPDPSDDRLMDVGTEDSPPDRSPPDKFAFDLTSRDLSLPAQGERSMAGPPRLYRTYVQTPLGQVHCRVARPQLAVRPPLLCLHMSPKSGWMFEPLLERLGRDRLVVAPDTPGFGMSDRPPQGPSLDDYRDALAAAAREFDANEAWDLLGYHTGSLIAMNMALSDPARVRRLALISVSLLSEDEIADYRRLGLGQPRDWDEAGEELLALWRLVLRWRHPGGSLANCARSLADTLLAGETSWWGHRAAFAFDAADAWKRLTHPVVIINPGDDLAAATRRAALLRPDIPLIEKPGWSHGFIQEAPDQAAALIASLLAA